MVDPSVLTGYISGDSNLSFIGSKCMYIYVCTCVCVYLCVCTCVCKCVYVCIMYVSVYVCTRMCKCISLYEEVYVRCVSVCVKWKRRLPSGSPEEVYRSLIS